MNIVGSIKRHALLACPPWHPFEDNMKVFMSGLYRLLRGVFIGVALLAAAGVFAYVVIPWHKWGSDLPLAKETSEGGEKIRRSGSDGITLPIRVARKMGIRTAQAEASTRPIKLPPFQGCLALDSNGLAHVRPRFAGEVVSVGSTTDRAGHNDSPPEPRPLRSGDRVKQGDLLAVVWSKDLGEKKSELVDAISKLRADTLVLTSVRELVQKGAGAERSQRDAERVVESDRVAVARAERTLRAWGLPADEVASIQTEADNLARTDSKQGDPTRWARVEVRSPRDGIVLEKNLASGDIVDTTTDMYKIGDLSHLAVWAHVYEEDLPLLQAMPKPVHWTVRLSSRPGTYFEGTLDQVGEVIDPNQHTALVSGRVENLDGELKVGQFVTVSVDLPPLAGEIELPTNSVVEDGRESVVFVQAEQNGERYVRREVQVVRRLRDAIYIRAEPGGVQPGQRVVTDGALLLREAMEGLPRPNANPTPKG